MHLTEIIPYLYVIYINIFRLFYICKVLYFIKGNGQRNFSLAVLFL
ncbi:hypothetical protein HME7025_01224 [Aquirufa nivalisilvae]|uniref:Uncharacterized protein n=1 Tax=Aquirufa nivalisilvae TaxID=2516557 RepID=A0A2S2DUQ1_9BACT|nr:hypothetical protein HME7025_01224 [Aquirufa nivalisilvae]